MAEYYFRSGASGANDGSSWADAYTSFFTSAPGKAAGDVFYVSDDHSELGTNVLITLPGTIASPNKVLCCNHTGSEPPTSSDLTTGAVLGASSGYFRISGQAYLYGITTQAATALALSYSGGFWQKWENCIVGCGTNNPTFSSASNKLTLVNCVYKPGAATNQIVVSGILHWYDTASAIDQSTATLTNNLFANSVSGEVHLRGLDLSAATSLSAIFPVETTAVGCRVITQDCKLPSGVTLASNPTSFGMTIINVRSDSAATNYQTRRQTLGGVHIIETTVVRTGGASDGTTPISWKITTDSNTNQMLPFETATFQKNNTTTGSSVTATVYGTWSGSGSTPLNTEIWIEVKYLSSASSPISSIATSAVSNILVSGSNITSDSTSTWGGSVADKFKMSVTFTPQMEGYVLATVKCAKASSTFYIDPKIYFS